MPLSVFFVKLIISMLNLDKLVGSKQHGRIQHIDVTPEGSALLAACRDRSGGIEQDLVNGFTPEEEEVVRRWLVHVAKLGNDKPAA